MNLECFDIQGNEKDRGFLELALKALPKDTIPDVGKRAYIVRRPSNNTATIEPREG